WYGTFKENQGPDTGAEALPARYTVRLRVDGRSYERPLVVLADPRDGDATDRYAKRYAFLSQLFGELSSIDTWLNEIDEKLKTGNPSQAAALRAFASELSSSPRNVEDLSGATALRNRIGDLLSRLSSSFQAPNAAQVQEGNEIKATFDALSVRRNSLGIP
ncbi:MAG TPA: hypothetical protein VKB39_02375, partial [Candidatus Baltobacteraceae bacterium]|nr:hypothetical protein [Candidatus Baltobacteraceae bacterium]